MNQQQTGFSAVLWLARFEFSRLWISYVVTGGFMLVMGTLVASSVDAGGIGSDAVRDRSDSFFADFVMLLLTTLLATTYTSWGALSDWRNPAERQLAMMRTFPVPVSTLVGSRMVLMLGALFFTVPAFFLPIYLLGDTRLGLGAYLAFIAFWVGYALISAALTMYLEIVRGSRYFFLFSFVSAAFLIGLVVLVSFVLAVEVVYSIAELSINYGLILGPAALIVGAVVFSLAGRLTTRDLQYREIPA